MEKQSDRTKSKSFPRLLIILLFFTFFTANLFSQTLSQAQIKALTIKPVLEKDFFTKTDLEFSVVIPKVKSSQVQIMPQNLPSEISFKTVRKVQNYEEDGTKIEIWYSFEKPGTYKIPDLPVMIQNRKRNIKFQTIQVQDDPSKQTPKMLIVFENGHKISSKDPASKKEIFSYPAGQKLKFTLYLQYAVQLVGFSWDLPQDSIFTKTKSFEITEVKYREKNYTHELIPVACFEWTCLKKGKQTLPKIKITATGYSGYRNDLLFPELFINFTEAKSSSNQTDFDEYDQAFMEPNLISEKNDLFEISQEECQKLAQLYSKERRAIFNYQAEKKSREAYENQLGLPATNAEDYSALILLLSITGGVVFLVFFIISIKKHHIVQILLFGSLLLLALVIMFYSIGKRSISYGICKGCQISSIPDDKAESISEISAGNRVEIIEKAGKWYYIELGQTGGWCLQDNIILIK